MYVTTEMRDRAFSRGPAITARHTYAYECKIGLFFPCMHDRLAAVHVQALIKSLSGSVHVHTMHGFAQLSLIQ